jgi:two-component system chemotaxis response regulator CheB
MTKILIAEDDSLLLKLLETALRPSYPNLTLMQNGLHALESLRRQPVDVLVTDWMMPGMDGIELIRRVRAEISPPPFIIMSTVLGSNDAREHALRSGADDFLVKPARMSEIRACIEHATQRHASSRKLVAAKPVSPRLAWRASDALPQHVVVAVAASTGGPVALHALFEEPSLPRDAVYLVALHGPEWLHESLVTALRRHSKLDIRLAEDGLVAQPGTVYFACKDRHLVLDAALRLKFDDAPPEHFLRPAADPLFRSVARVCGPNALGLVLTGMGNDGAAGAAELAAVGGTILAQDPRTAVIGSMPNAVINAGIVKEVIPLVGIGAGVARHLTPMLSAHLARRRVGRTTLAS